MAAGTVDVHGDFAIRVLRFQEQQLGDDQVGHHIVHTRPQEDDAVLEEPGIDIVGPLAPVGLFDHHRYQCHGMIPFLFMA